MEKLPFSTEKVILILEVELQSMLLSSAAKKTKNLGLYA